VLRRARCRAPAPAFQARGRVLGRAKAGSAVTSAVGDADETMRSTTGIVVLGGGETKHNADEEGNQNVV
jgi:hypothetical protein